jgi:hypothetical protein
MNGFSIRISSCIIRHVAVPLILVFYTMELSVAISRLNNGSRHLEEASPGVCIL